MQTVYLSAGYTMGPHYFAGSIGWLNATVRQKDILKTMGLLFSGRWSTTTV